MNFFFWRKSPPVLQSPLRGVNLGGWLVLEKWMTPSLFAGLQEADEYGYCQAATLTTVNGKPEVFSGELRKRLQTHRDTFITRSDFVWLKEHGIDAVRLPVGYWAFGDEEPYSGTLQYIDNAFTWAQQTGIKILLDLHGAPGSQNGRDHSGQAGQKQWHKDEKNIIKTLEIMEKLISRYKGRKCLLGIELLNEPGWMFRRRLLRRYYTMAYKMVRKICGNSVWVVYSDFFPPLFWARLAKLQGYTNLYVDTHHYQAFGRSDRRLNILGHMKMIRNKIPRKLRRLQKHNPVIVGEWSLVLPQKAIEGMDENQLTAVHRDYGGAQLTAFEPTRAWFYWSYKTETGGAWDFRDCVEKGLLPTFRGIRTKSETKKYSGPVNRSGI